jgi:hypothetical protein
VAHLRVSFFDGAPRMPRHATGRTRMQGARMTVPPINMLVQAELL